MSQSCDLTAGAHTNHIRIITRYSCIVRNNKMWMPSTLKMVLRIVVLILWAVSARGWGINHAQPGTGAKCERLNVSFCRGLRYNLTAMPNFMGHEDQRQAERGVILILKENIVNCFLLYVGKNETYSFYVIKIYINIIFLQTKKFILTN